MELTPEHLVHYSPDCATPAKPVLAKNTKRCGCLLDKSGSLVRLKVSRVG